MLQKIDEFLRREIWRIRLRRLPRAKYFLIRMLRVILLAGRGFDENRCQLRASALTFYTLLSVVPLLAMAFGVAKGFGFERNLESIVQERLQTQPEVAMRIITFSKDFIATTKGGLIAGVGLVVLFWTVIKVLGNVEESFNDIWGVKKGRSFGRKLSEYLSIMLICPVMLVTASSLTVFITAQVTAMAEKVVLLSGFSRLIVVSLKILPYCVVWIVFSFVYMFMPNTRVSWKAGILAGVVAGTTYQAVQWAYIFFQIGVSKYNAIYGSFAALPLFLIWLQASWLVVLFGAEISFAVDNEETYEFEHDCLQVSPRFKRIVTLRIVELCSKQFASGQGPLNTVEMAHRMEAPIRLVRDIIHDLVDSGVLVEVKTREKDSEYYQPAQDTEHLTIKGVFDRLDKRGFDHSLLIKPDEVAHLASKLEAMDRLLDSSAENILVKNL